LKSAIEKAGYTGKVLSILFSFYLSHDSTLYIIDRTSLLQVVIGMDVAAAEFYSEKDKTYDLNFKEDVRFT
jgi:hypothetical protein